MEEKKDTFMSEGERDEIRKNYVSIRDHIKVHDLIPMFVEQNIISKAEKSSLDAEKDDLKKAERIIDNVFMKATYLEVQKIKRILYKSGADSHKNIASMLPTREVKSDSWQSGIEKVTTSMDVATFIENDDANEPHRTSAIPNTMKSVTTPVEERNSRTILSTGSFTTESKNEEPSSPPNSNFIATSDADVFSTMPEVDQMENYTRGEEGDPTLHSNNHLSNANTSPNLRPAGITSTVKNLFGKSHAKSLPDIKKEETDSSIPERMQPGLTPYKVKPGNDETYGNGLCVVIANFTGDLIGYNKDCNDIKTFHQDILKWKHVFVNEIPSDDPENSIPLNNLCQKQLMDVLKCVQDFLKNPLGEGRRIDRFFLYLLSHGDGNGIGTCKPGSDGEWETDKEGEKVLVKIQDILDMFTHEKVPYLKEFPKVIFNQSCQGQKPLKAATIPTTYPSDHSISIHPTKEEWRPSESKIAIGADFAVCNATYTGTFSWVGDEQGSLFIQTTMDVFRAMHNKKIHFGDMMTVVNNIVSSSKKNGYHPDTKKVIPAVQMPCNMSRLRHSLYLAMPENYVEKAKFY